MSTHDLTSSHEHNSTMADQQPRADFPPPEYAYGSRPTRSPTLFDSIRRHWVITLLPAIVLAAAGIAVGAKKQPTYSSTATINVGKADIATQATPGYVTAAEALASAYSRLVASQHIVVPAAHAVHQPVAKVAPNLTAVPIPNEPTFTVTSRGSSPQAAVALGNAAVSALQHYAIAAQTQQGSPAELMAKFMAARTAADRLQRRSGALQGSLAANVPGVTAAKVVAAESAAQAAELQAQALGNAYVNLSQSAVAPTLDVLNDPTTPTSSNRTSNIEKYGVVGAIAGLVIGMGLAAMVGAIKDSRRFRRP
jgi:hypothetical protein